jgi:hypothetical protein
MTPKLVLCVLTLGTACAVPCRAQALPDAATPRPVAAAPAPERGEPNVRYTVIEDDGARIEELRVRGQVQSVKVKPKVGPRKGYEVLTGDGGRILPEATGAGKSTVGKTVWSVLDF